VGCIFGLGESDKQRVEIAFEIKGLDTTGAIPLNFLNQIKGTRSYGLPKLRAYDVLKIIAMFRFAHPGRRLRMGGGREVNLRDLQPLMFLAGIDATITGNYLTTTGKNCAEDMQMIKDLGLMIA
jgi:biotin synthase